MHDWSRRSVLRALGSATIATLSGCLDGRGDATTSRSTTKSGSTTTETTETTETTRSTETTETETVDPSPEPVATPAWSTGELPGTVADLWVPEWPPTPETSGGPLYATTDRGVLATVEVLDGTVRWTYEAAGTRDEHDHPSFTQFGGTIYLVSGTRTDELLRNYVEAIDPDTGERAWTFDTREFLTPLGVVDGTLYLTGYFIKAPPDELGPNQSPRGDGHLHAVDAATGEERWSRTVSRLDDATVAGHGCYATEELSLETDRTRLIAFDHDGTERWSVETNTFGPGIPTATDDALYASADGGAARYDPETGEVRWTAGQWERGPGQIVVLDDDTVFAGGHPLLALTADGEVRYRIQCGGRVVRPVTDDTLYIEGGREVQAIDRDAGHRRWTYEPRNAKYTHPKAVVRDGLFVHDGIGYDDELLLVGVDTGEKLGQFRTDQHYQTATGLGNRVLVGVGRTVRAYEVTI